MAPASVWLRGRVRAALEQAQAHAPEPLWLVDQVFPWGSDVYAATDRTVPDLQIAYLTGRFRVPDRLCRVPTLMVLSHVLHHGQIRRSEVIDLCHLTEDQAAKLLKRLKDDGRLVQSGEQRWAFYTLNESLLAP